jgi:hypothetical protein
MSNAQTLREEEKKCVRFTFVRTRDTLNDSVRVFQECVMLYPALGGVIFRTNQINLSACSIGICANAELRDNSKKN